jgi:putative methionine-R-sulfoxide reductase with GAF domain
VRELNSQGSREERMRRVVDVLWDGLHQAGVSWVGFYTHESGEELALGPSRNKPACTPIGLHGACGRAFLQQQPLIVRDVKSLGDNYIACDPRDRSEVVVPLIEPDGSCRGVLDLDSYEVVAFDERDVQGLIAVLRAAGLTSQSDDAAVITV